ncbi:MAG: cobalamin biosynthesis protein CobN [Thermoproteota archaeon]|nr:MAG: cobalamin biosynthesis protein CobN [Candidatus Korarchaeota archaeon]
MKIAVVGKGGVGKTTIAGTLARFLARDGYNVLAVDADPNLNLHMSLGIEESIASRIVPISENAELIRARTGSSFGAILRMNPKVDDIVDRFGIVGPDEVKLIVMGTVRAGNSGCMCPENAFLRALMSHLVMGTKDVVIMDMVAGLEHLGRGTARGVNCMLCVVEPGAKSIITAKRILKLSKDIGIKNFLAVGNKVRGEEQIKLIYKRMEELGIPVIGNVPYDDALIRAEIAGKAPLDLDPECKAVKAIRELKNKLVEKYFLK